MIASPAQISLTKRGTWSLDIAPQGIAPKDGSQAPQLLRHAYNAMPPAKVAKMLTMIPA